MMNSRYPLQLIGVLIIAFCAFGCSGGKIPLIGEITGPSGVTENYTVEYYINVEKSNGTTFLWSCDPPGAGELGSPVLPKTTFKAGLVENDTQITISVLVESVQFGPVLKSREILILNKPPTAKETESWTRTWGGYGNERSHAIYVDEYGNSFITGYFSGMVDFDPSSDIDKRTSQGDTDIFLCKYNYNGDYQWAITWGGAGQDKGNGITLDKNGYIYITGNFSGTVDFDPGPVVVNRTSFADNDVFLIKLDFDGNLFWANTWGGILGDVGFDVAVDDLGNVYVTGYFWDTVDFDPDFSEDIHVSLGENDAFISKFDSYGRLIWAYTWGSYSQQQGRGVEIDNEGNIYVTGKAAGTVDYDPGPGVDKIYGVQYSKAYLSKFDASGDYQWVRTWAGKSEDINGYCIDIDNSGNIYIAGSCGGKVDFDPGPELDEYVSSKGSDIYITKFDSAGNHLWAHGWGGAGHDRAFALATDNDENVYVAGAYRNTVDFDPGEQVDERISNGNSDMFLSKFDASGELHWAYTLGAGAFDAAYGIGTDYFGNVYFTGAFNYTIDFDPGNEIDYHASLGPNDVFLSRIPVDGNW